MNNQTPRSVASQAALLASIAVVSVLCVVLYSTDKLIWWFVPVFFVLTFALVFIVTFWSIEKFIYQKVKVILRSIHSVKRNSKREDLKRSKGDVLEAVNLEVKEWAEVQSKEIRDLQISAEHRREFIGNLAHELKTPVFNIQGYILTLLEGALEDKKNNRRFLEKASKNVDRITSLLSDLDQITRIESGDLALFKENFDLIELTNEVMEAAERSAKKKGVKLEIKHQGNKSVMVHADRRRMGQVLTNLVMNSIKYGKDDGGHTVVKFYDLEDRTMCEVKDNGLGIAKEDLPRIFERFYRVDKSRARHVAGSGLGLSIVEHIIDAHDQTISVSSEQDLGSTFSFTLEKASKN